MGAYKATFSTDGDGKWSVILPTDCDKADFMALGPVIDAIKAFVEPTIDKPPARRA